MALRKYGLGVVCVCFFIVIENVKATAPEEDGFPNKADGVHFCGEYMPFQNQRVAQHFWGILQESKGRVARIKTRANLFFKTIDPILKQHQVPEDFKYLSIVESALQANATSSKGAHGYWQFMPETARAMGLTISKNTDERRNLVKSTHAACRYFKHLFAQLGSWTLVAAAYNAGPGKLDEYMNRAQSMSYYDLNLRRETGEYLYRVVATKELLTRPERYQSPAVIGDLHKKEKAQYKAAELFLPTPKTRQFIADLDDPTPAKTVLDAPKQLAKNVILTRLREVAPAQKGQVWTFEVTETRVIDNLLIEANDRLYAVVEDVSAKEGLIYLRTLRFYSAHRHEFYNLPFTAINNAGDLGVLTTITTTESISWKRF